MKLEDFYRGDVNIVVKDESGKILMDMASGLTTLPEEYDILNHCHIISFEKSENKVGL